MFAGIGGTPQGTDGPGLDEESQIVRHLSRASFMLSLAMALLAVTSPWA